jgi:hypothetical protein
MEDFQEAAHLSGTGLLAGLLLLVESAEVGVLLRAEEEEIGNDWLAVVAPRETVDTDVSGLGTFAEVLVEALEEATVEERNVLEEIEGGGRSGEVVAVPVGASAPSCSGPRGPQPRWSGSQLRVAKKRFWRTAR